MSAAVIAVLFASSGAALAQEPAPAPQAGTPAAERFAADAVATVSTPAHVEVGQPVRDANGSIIGEVKELKIDDRGRELASIKMWNAAFAIETKRLAIVDGAAVVGATEADLRWLLSLPTT